MLKITQAAGDRLQRYLQSADEGCVVRIVRRARRLKLRPSRPRPGDTTFSHDGQVVLVLAHNANRVLASRTLDAHDTNNGPRLQLKSS